MAEIRADLEEGRATLMISAPATIFFFFLGLGGDKC